MNIKMKIFKYIFISLLGSMTFVSCDKDDDYTAGPQNEGESVSFGTITSSEQLTYLPDEDLSVSFAVYRADATSEADVPLDVIENENDMFVIPSSIHFAAGEKETQLSITFPDMGLGETASFEIAISDGYQNLYATNMLRRSITRDYKWLTYTGTITSVFDGLEDSPVKIQRADGYNIWRVVDPFTEYCEAYEMEYDYSILAQYINFVVGEDGNVSFTTYLNDLYQDGVSQIYATWPAELGKSTENNKALDSYTVQLEPIYYLPDLGAGFQADEQNPFYVTITLDESSNAKFGEFGEPDSGSESE